MAPDQLVQINARPHPMRLEPGRAAVIVVDMENDFGAHGGMFHRAGLDISGIQAAIAPTARVLPGRAFDERLTSFRKSRGPVLAHRP